MAKSPNPKKEDAPTAEEKKQVEAAGIVLGNDPESLGQKSAPVDPALRTTKRAPSRRHGPLVDVDANGKFTSPLVQGKSFDALLDLIQFVS